MEFSDELLEESRKCRHRNDCHCLMGEDECRDGMMVRHLPGGDVTLACDRYRPMLNEDELRALEQLCDGELKGAVADFSEAVLKFATSVNDAFKAVRR